MVTNKAIAIGKDIDAARCKGNWQAIPELARRYKKHNPSGIVLEQSILAENELNKLVQANQTQSIKQIYQNDTPNSISFPARLDPNLFKGIKQQLANALGDKDTSSETQLLKQMTKIILARTYFESGEYEKTLEAIQDSGLKIQDSSSGYSFSVYIQALSMKAMSLDLLEKQDEAIEAYQALVSAINQSPNFTDRSSVDWSEDALYRGTLYALSERCQTLDVTNTMNLIRAYQKACSSQTTSWRIYKRLTVTRNSISYLSSVYRQGKYQPPVDFSQTEEGKQTSKEHYAVAKNNYNHQLFSIEIMQLYTIYEKLVNSLVQFPKPGKPNRLMLDFIETFAADFELVGGAETEWRGFIEVLNRAALKTFNSPCVTRHLFLALFQLGDYEEAEQALRSYLYLSGLESKAMLDARDMTPALATDASGYNTPIPNPNESDEHPEETPSRSQEVESTRDKLSVLTTAVKMYCTELSKGSEAVYVAELALRVYDKEIVKQEHQPEDAIQLRSTVYRAAGIAYGFLATQTFDPSQRPKYHEKASNALKKSLEIDSKNWQTYYEFALQLAEMRDITQSMQMVTQSLQLNPNHLPSWHLLSLLCTCPIKSNYNQALKTCDAALAKSTQSILESISVDYTDDIAQLISFKTTQTLLVGLVQGPSAAMAAQEELFQVFGKIMIPELIPDTSEVISTGNPRYGTVLSGSLGNFNEASVSSGSSELKTRARSLSHGQVSRSRSNSSFTGRKLHLAEVFNNSHSDTASVKSVSPQTTHSLTHKSSKLSLLDPKNLIRKTKKDTSVDDLGVKSIKREKSDGSMKSSHSAAPSVISTNTLLQSTTVTTRPTTLARLNHQRSCKILCDLWLLSAHGYLRSGKLEEARKAVSEAENVDWTTHAGVWCALGRIYIEQKQYHKAMRALQKGLVTKPNDVECRIWLAKTYVEQGHLELAEGLLRAVTQENGWNNASAWFYLGEIYKKTDRLERTKDCLFYALELENTTPIQPFTILPRFV